MGSGGTRYRAIGKATVNGFRCMCAGAQRDRCRQAQERPTARRSLLRAHLPRSFRRLPAARDFFSCASEQIGGLAACASAQTKRRLWLLQPGSILKFPCKSLAANEILPSSDAPHSRHGAGLRRVGRCGRRGRDRRLRDRLAARVRARRSLTQSQYPPIRLLVPHRPGRRSPQEIPRGQPRARPELHIP